jgi:putative hydrolase of HD superfamily
MRELINFFTKIQKLKEMPKRGWLLIGIKNPETIGTHTFRLAIMAWFLAKKKKNFDIERILKIALIHDLCELYAGDTTPYDYSALPKDKKKWPELFDKWPRASKSQKIRNFLEKHRKEKASLLKLIKKLPSETRKEILSLWMEYEKESSKEAKFVKQVNRLETLLQALEYAKETKRRPFRSWWIGSKEKIDDSLLVEFMSELDKKFHNKHVKTS